MGNKKYSNEELIEYLKKVYKEKGYITKNTINECGEIKEHVYYRRFGTLNNAMAQAGINIEENKKRKNEQCLKGTNQQYSRQDLINILIDYYNNIGFPTQRKFNSKNGLPGYVTYYNEFGSFKNAILMSGITIPKERERYFNREKLTDSEMLKLLQFFTDKKLNNEGIFLLTNEELDNIPNIPHSGTYNSRFGGIINAYQQIDINYKEFNKKALEQDMKRKYIKAKELLGHTPNSRELNNLSKQNLCYCMEAYEEHFGSLSELQKKMGDIPTKLGISMSYDEIVEGLYKLYKELGSIPTQNDINECKYIPNINCINEYFKSTKNMQLTLFGETYSKNKITSKGTICNSSYEYKIARVLETYNIEFKKEEFYKNYIKDFNKRYRFDFTIEINNKKYFIEIFGMKGNDSYDEKTLEKIKLCKNNNLPLISLYPEDFYSKTYENLYKYLIDTIRNMNANNIK